LGILITQMEGNWIISLREDWYIENGKDVRDVVEYLSRYGVDMGIVNFDNFVKIHMHNSNVKVKDYDQTKAVVLELMEFKRKFGQAIKLEKKSEKDVKK
jgi:hypothetical protein